VEQNGTIGLVDEVRMPRETVAVRTKQYLVLISSVSGAVRVASRETVPYLVTCLHADAGVSYILDIVLRAPELVASLNLRGHKNDVGSKIWESHVHECLDYIARSNMPLEETGHSVDSIRKLAVVSATLPSID